jgi:S1-C subfamily serine protease
MTKRNLLITFGTVALGLSLAAVPAVSAQTQSSQDNSVASLKREIAQLKAQLATQEIAPDRERVEISGPEVIEIPEAPVVDVEEELQEQEVAPPAAPNLKNFVLSFDGDGSSWLGVETQEVTSEKAKDLKVSADHGVFVGKVLSDSPASKAGLKENDVVTEINGQRVEGTAQFRRMIREIPAGRAVQLSIWRDGKQQTITATLGKAEERHKTLTRVSPQTFAFRVPQMPEIPDVPGFEWNGGMLAGGKPRLGIDAEDLSGQLGAYFGAPEGEGILVRSVNNDSAAEKAGVKAGDVITSFNGDRIRTAGELREKLAGVEAGKTVKLGVLRNRSNVTLTVELPAPVSKEKRKTAFRTNI